MRLGRGAYGRRTPCKGVLDAQKTCPNGYRCTPQIHGNPGFGTNACCPDGYTYVWSMGCGQPTGCCYGDSKMKGIGKPAKLDNECYPCTPGT